MWNNINYLLKMPTDLDYIDQYRAITDWLGFSILRNPFIVPYAMETNPRGMNSLLTDTNTPLEYSQQRPPSSSKLRAKFRSPRLNAPSPDLHRPNQEAFSPNKQRNNTTSSSSFSALLQDPSSSTPLAPITTIADPMTLVRHAESVLLFEEQKYGKLDRDPLGRIVPQEQAYMKHLSVNLHKDSHRKMIEETVSKPEFAPHTVRSGVGFASRPWYPGEGDDDDDEAITATAVLTEEEKLSQLSSTQNLEKNPWDEITRNKYRVGGLLNSLQSRAADIRRRYPIQPNHGNEIEFKNVRQVRSLEDTLGSINAVRDKIEAEKANYLKKKIGGKKSKGKLSARHESGGEEDPSPAVVDPPCEVGVAQQRSEEEEEKHQREKQQMELVLQQYVKMDQEGRNRSSYLQSAATATAFPGSEIDQDKAYQLSKAMLTKEITFLLQLKKLKIYHQKLQDFKSIHHSEIVKERSREIERKRRLLSYQEAIKRGPPGDEPANAYDYYATKLQTQVRRWTAMKFVAWFRIESNVASKKIQTRARGMIGRVRWKRLKKEKDAATEIQRNYRGMASRVSHPSSPFPFCSSFASHSVSPSPLPLLSSSDRNQLRP
jgi:hypothetical protein